MSAVGSESVIAGIPSCVRFSTMRRPHGVRSLCQPGAKSGHEPVSLFDWSPPRPSSVKLRSNRRAAQAKVGQLFCWT